MNKMEILGLLFRCDATISGYLRDKTFDTTKVTEENLNRIKEQINRDYTDISAMRDNDDFTEYQNRYESLATLAADWAMPIVNAIDQAYSFLISDASTQEKLDAIERLTLSEKAKDVLAMIVSCQDNINTINADASINDTSKAIINATSDKINDDIRTTLNGADESTLDMLYDKYEGIVQMCQTTLMRRTVTKSEMLETIFTCKREASDILSDNTIKLSRKEKKQINHIISEAGKDYMDCYDLNNDDPRIKEYVTKYAEFNDYLGSIRGNQVNRHTVASRVSRDDVPETTRKSGNSLLKTIFALIGAGLVGALIAAIIFHCINTTDLDNVPTNTDTSEPSSTEELIDDLLLAQNINIDNYDELFDFACKIQTKLPSDANITVDDIMYALRLANFDKLQDKAYFSDRDEVCAATYVIGKLAPSVGVDALVQRAPEDDIILSEQQMKDILMTVTDNELAIDSFASAKVDGGYDIYKAANICLSGIYLDNKEVAFIYAKVMNELVCREAVNYSICPNSPVSTHYVIAGMYTANQDRILELTSGMNLGPIYGTGPRIDGTHGALCVEELASFMYIDAKGGTFIGNEKNAIYSFVIDENITNNWSLDR